MFLDNRESGRPVLLMFWICLWRVILEVRCSPPVSAHAHSSGCNASCRERQFCDTIEQRCSPCSARVCQLKIAKRECQPFCTENRIRWAEKDGSSLESALEKMSKSRVPVDMVITMQLATFLLLATLFASLVAFYMRYREILVKFTKSKHARLESTQMVKRNNLDVEMSFLKNKAGYDQGNVRPPMIQTFSTFPTLQTPPTFQTSEFGIEPQPRCTCEGEEIIRSSNVDTGSGVPRDVGHDRRAPCRNSDPGHPGLLDASSVESRSLLTDYFIQPSPLSQDL